MAAFGNSSRPASALGLRGAVVVAPPLPPRSREEITTAKTKRAQKSKSALPRKPKAAADQKLNTRRAGSKQQKVLDLLRDHKAQRLPTS